MSHPVENEFRCWVQSPEKPPKLVILKLRSHTRSAQILDSKFDKKYQTIKETLRENTPSNKTQALTKKNINMEIQVHGILNELLIGSYTQIKFSKYSEVVFKVVSGITPFFVIGTILLTIRSLLTSAFDKNVQYWNVALLSQVPKTSRQRSSQEKAF